MNIIKKIFEKNQNIFIYKIIIIVLLIINLILVGTVIFFQKEIKKFQIKKKNIIIDRIYFNENIKLVNYSDVRYKIKDEGKEIINNIRNVHKAPVLIGKELQNKELCAGYIGELSMKIWGKKSMYSFGLQNISKGRMAQAWELPYFYEAFGGKVLIDFSNKFSLKEKDYLQKIDLKDMKTFFAKTFSEKALFGDIGFLYRKTKYTNFLKNWSSNSHITKNMGISDFEIILSEFDNHKSNIENLMVNMGCDNGFMKYIKLFQNYKLLLNDKNIVFYKNDFYYINQDNILGKKIKFKYLDKISYKDIAITHFFDKKSHVDSLLQFTCNLNFLPINVISINSRMIEKK